jgi:hypothetical protein
MRAMLWIALGVSLGLALFARPVQAAPPRISVGLNFGFPVYPRPYYHPYCYDHYHYRPYSAWYYERPVYMAPSPTVVVQERYVPVPAPTPSPAPQYNPQPQGNAPPPEPLPSVFTTSGTATAANAKVNEYMQMLNDPEETERSQAVIELGRLKSERAVDPLTATLAGDRSPMVRETAARALGLIGSPRSLTALTYAAQADPAQEVRQSAQFAVNVIQATQR